MRRRWTLALAGVVAGLAGCGGRPGAATQPAAQLNLTQITTEALEQVYQEKDPKDPVPFAQVIVFLDLYQLDVPLGTISRNEEFWKRINEQCVDVTTYDLLYKNGIRVGQAPIAEWDFFKKVIDQNPTRVTQRSVTAVEGRGVELEAKKDLPEQTLGWWDRNNDLSMRTFDRSDNLLALSFLPTPRQLGSVRVTLCPTVRATRKRWVVTVRNEEQEVEYTAPERVYDVNLCADVPPETFLIVAPSPDVRGNMNLGRAFFVKDGLAERFEQLLLIVPRPYKVEAQGTASAR